MTRVATNVRECVRAAQGKPLLFFPARFDVPEVQEYDGYAARIGGAAGASTKAGARAFPTGAVGTMPHALIAAFKGDTVAASLAMAEAGVQGPIWALVDFRNNSARESVAVFRAFKERGLELDGVRLDTSQGLVDESIQHLERDRPREELTGVCPELVHEVRNQLDDAGGREVKIAVSGGFSAEKITSFETQRVPVDVYAVGERLLRGSNPFTSDIVGYYEQGKLIPCAKIGRELRHNTRLRRVIR
jgi:nicotinate phosphoribosyltransferase